MSKFSQTLFSSVKKTKNVAAFLSRNLVVVNLLLFVLTVSMAASYIVQVNRSATKGYQIRELENSINQLELDNQTMKVKIAEAKSMENISAKVPMLGMIKVETQQYVSGGSAVVSLNR